MLTCIWMSTSRVEACVALQLRLWSVTADTRGAWCLSAHQGYYLNKQTDRGRAKVAVHTTDTALLLFHQLYKQCVRCKKQNRSSLHLVIDEANGRRQGPILNRALTLQQQGLLHLRILSKSMPD